MSRFEFSGGVMRFSLLPVVGWSLLAGLLPVSGQAAGVTPAAKPKSGLSRLLEGELGRWPVKSSGVFVKHLGTGEQAGVRENALFASASTIKLPVLVLAFELAEQGKLDLTKRYVIQAKDLRGGSGIFQFQDVGLKPTLRDVLTQMVITSDNTATDIMIAQVGGAAKVNEFLQQRGYRALRLNGTTFDFFRALLQAVDGKFSALTPEQVFGLFTERPAFREPYKDLIAQFEEASKRNPKALDGRSEDPEKWFGVASPREMAELLEGIEKCTVARPASCDEMKRILRAQQVRQKIPHYLTVPVGNKTGETGSVTNDVAIIYSRSGPIVMTSYNMGLEGDRAEVEDGMGRLARMVVEYFDGK